MESRILTLATLVQVRACEAQRLVFEGIFGDKVEVTVERFSQPDVIEAQFDYDWAAELLLTEETREAFYEEFRKQRDELKAKHHVGYYSQVPREEKNKLEARLWAEFYVKGGRTIEPVEEPGVEANHIVTEGSTDGD